MPAQCRDEVGGNRPAKVDRHRGIEPVDMDGAVEAIMQTRRDMAAQKALGHFIVVPQLRDRAIPQRRLGRELDHRLLDLQARSPKRGLLRLRLPWPVFPAQSPRLRTDRWLQTQRNFPHHALAALAVTPIAESARNSPPAPRSKASGVRNSRAGFRCRL